MTDSEASPSFRVAYVPGVTPTKWVRIWNERLPGTPLELVPTAADGACDVLGEGGADVGFVRLPVDRAVFSAIPLYTETTVVVIPRDHLVTAADEVRAEELADDVVLHPLDDVLDWEELPGLPAVERPATTADAIELVAAGVGVLVVPQSLARLHHRRDLTYRTVADAPVSQVALAWPEERTTHRVEDFIGIVRGRTVNSTRGRQQPAASGQPKGETSGNGARRKPASGAARGKNPQRRTVGGPKSGGRRRGGKPRRRS